MLKRSWIVPALSACMSVLPAFAADPSRYIVSDFEDVSTWRTSAVSGVPNTKWFSGGIFVGSSQAEKCSDQYVGEIRYAFVSGTGGKEIAAERVRVSEVSAFLDAIEFRANPKGFSSELSFELMDSAGKRFRTSRVAMDGSEWKTYRVDINDKTVRDFAQMKSPVKLRRLFLSTKQEAAAAGSVFIDDITLVGTVTKERKVSIWPIYRDLYSKPGDPVTIAYRLRHADPTERTVTLGVQAQNSYGQTVADTKKEVKIGGYGQQIVEFDLGVLPVGPYGLTVKVEGERAKAEITDWVGVFEPVGKRINKRGMLFGMGDQTLWQAEEENRLHLTWMKMIGVDIDRFGVGGPRMEPQQGVMAAESFTKMIRDHEAAGIDISALYMDVPSWTQSKPKYRHAPDDYEAFAQHAQRVSQFLAQFPNVKYLEFWNEPELDFFAGTREEYMKMLKIFYDAIKQASPSIQVGAGSQTSLDHPKHKKGFEDVFFLAKDYYDVAVFHSHGNADSYVREHETIAGILKKNGVNKPMVNTEAGERAGYSIQGGWNQAEALARKMIYARYQASEFYMWFTLQDYWDMDFGADDSFGLITADNHPKPSCLAYNQMVRELASTLPAPPVQLHSDIVTYPFTNPDTKENVYVCWPRRDGLPVILALRGAPITSVTDIYGRKQQVGKIEDTSLISVAKSPIYIRTNGTLSRADADMISYSRELALVPGGSSTLPVQIKNVWNKPTSVTVSLLDDMSKVISSQKLNLAVGETGTTTLAISMQSKEQSLGMREYSLKLETSANTDSSLNFPLAVFTCYGIAKGDHLATLNKVQAIPSRLKQLTLNNLVDVHEITHDPAIPQWSGTKDLSVIAAAEHDENGILFYFDVTDDKHVQPHQKDLTWRGDGIQLAMTDQNGRMIELDVALTANGPEVWASVAPNQQDIGAVDVPVKITREGDQTRYRLYVPFAKLGIQGNATGKPFRFAFIVNENDGQGRVRWLHWFDGIGKSKNAAEFGYGMIE